MHNKKPTKKVAFEPAPFKASLFSANINHQALIRPQTGSPDLHRLPDPRLHTSALGAIECPCSLSTHNSHQAIHENKTLLSHWFTRFNSVLLNRTFVFRIQQPFGLVEYFNQGTGNRITINSENQSNKKQLQTRDDEYNRQCPAQQN